MAAYMRGVTALLVSGKHVLPVARWGCSAEPKRYIRGLRRKPVRVLSADNETCGSGQSQPKRTKPQLKDERTEGTKHTKEAQTKGRPSSEPRESAQSGSRPVHVPVPGPMETVRFESALPGDKRLGRLVSVARSRTFREHQGKILLEGRRLICDALDAGAHPQTVFFSTVDRLKELPLDKLRAATLIKVKFEEIKIWSDLVAPQGVMAIFSRPDPSRLTFAKRGQSVPLSLICDNVRDPGNLGTMLRCAAAAGCHSVLLTKGCVDVWEPKVLRAAMGAHFRLPVFSNLEWENIREHLPSPVTVHVADSSRPSDAKPSASHQPPKAGDYGWVSSRLRNDSASFEESDSEDECHPFPEVESKLYFESWAQSPSVLVIGGETHGVSPQAYQMAENNEGYRLSIPIAAGVDSLNSAMAASILLFEGRRQLLQLLHTSGKKRQVRAERKT